eukprot:gene441-6854_t
MSKLKLALCQMTVGLDKEKNIQKAITAIRTASKNGSKLVVLPECFNSPYGTQYFEQYSEIEEKSTTLKQISEIAKECKVHILAGSIPTYNQETKKYLNSSYTFNEEGEIVAKFHKIHLFDINVPGKISFQESKVLSPGSELATFEIENQKIGVGICFDIRFAELAQLYQRKGCKLLLYPGAFNMTTGPLHWELLTRARALDNQIFVGVCSPARDVDSGYVAYGHSLISDPLGKVIGSLDEKEDILYSEIDFNQIDEIRNQIPVIKNKRNDLYVVSEK